VQNRVEKFLKIHAQSYSSLLLLLIGTSEKNKENLCNVCTAQYTSIIYVYLFRIPK